MKAVRLEQFGDPIQVTRCVDVEDPGAPGEREVLVAVEATPINPSDIMVLMGLYGALPELPATPGNEGVGTVLQVGGGVDDVKEGDRVLLPEGSGTWRQKLLLPADRITPLPADIDAVQASMMLINPPTAYLLLRDIVPLEEGDWVIQNAGNSAVAGYLRSFARERGIKTVNVVRREALIEPLENAGADVVLVDGADLGKRVRERTGGAKIKLGIDAVAGDATLRLADCLARSATLVSYGAMSGEPCRIAPLHTIFKDITLRGFWLAFWLARAAREERREVMAGVLSRIREGTLQANVEATYDLTRVHDALQHATQGGRKGKIVLTPQK